MGIFKDKLERPDPKVLFPVRACTFKVDEDDNVVVLLPRYGDSWFGRLCSKVLGRPYLRLPLDERGSAFWNYCDGQRNFAQVCQCLEDRFGEEVKPADDRGLVFLQTLLQQGCLSLMKEALAEPVAGPNTQQAS